MTVTVNMPQMAAGGLSENWLFKFCGDRHWQVLCRDLGTTSARLVTDDGKRLYASFVAIAARYSAPLSTLGENDILEETVNVARYGSSFFHGRVSLTNEAVTLRQETVTAFVARTTTERNDLMKSTPAASFHYSGETLLAPPELLTMSAKLRKGTANHYQIEGFTVPLGGPGLGLDERYDPSPYIDYNGANLLYYASYPTICDIAERRLIHAHRLIADWGMEGDWGLVGSTVARDVYYYRNLDLGDSVVVLLNRFERDGNRVLLHSSIRSLAGGAPLSDCFTVKQLAVPRWRP